MLFSYSDILSNDFENTKYKEHCIVLKKWLTIHPASEFRCLVINNVLWGITPRDWPTYYKHFDEDGLSIIDRIQTFFQEQIRGKFDRKNCKIFL